MYNLSINRWTWTVPLLQTRYWWYHGEWWINYRAIGLLKLPLNVQKKSRPINSLLICNACLSAYGFMQINYYTGVFLSFMATSYQVYLEPFTHLVLFTNKCNNLLPLLSNEAWFTSHGESIHINNFCGYMIFLKILNNLLHPFIIFGRQKWGISS